MKALVTGATGFLGGALARRLVALMMTETAPGLTRSPSTCVNMSPYWASTWCSASKVDVPSDLMSISKVTTGPFG